MPKKTYSEEEKMQFSEAGRQVRGFFKLLNVNNKTQEYLPLKRAVQFKIVKPDRSYTGLLQDIVDDDVSPACCTIEKADEIIASAIENFLLDVQLSDQHKAEYDSILSDEDKSLYLITLISKRVQEQNIQD